jgi:hypothetical protein
MALRGGFDRNCMTHPLLCAPNKRLCIVELLPIYFEISDNKIINFPSKSEFRQLCRMNVVERK